MKARQYVLAVVLVAILEFLVYMAWKAPAAVAALSKVALLMIATALLMFAAMAAIRLWNDRKDLEVAAQMALGLSAAFFAIALL